MRQLRAQRIRCVPLGGALHLSAPPNRFSIQMKANGMQGVSVVLTRPTGQNDALAARIRAAGGDVELLPLLDIAAPARPVAADVLRQQLSHADTVIFISPNAVRMALRALPVAEWPGRPRLAAIGQGTGRILREASLSDVLVPAGGADSEALLALPEFRHLAGQRVLLVRGEGGREHLAQTLSERGAHVDHAVVYRRVACPPDMRALRQRAGSKTWMFVITSSEALRVLVDAAREDADVAWLGAQGFIFAHPRIALRAQTLGMSCGVIVPTPDDDAVYAALQRMKRIERHLHRRNGQ